MADAAEPQEIFGSIIPPVPEKVKEAIATQTAAATPSPKVAAPTIAPASAPIPAPEPIAESDDDVPEVLPVVTDAGNCPGCGFDVHKTIAVINGEPVVDCVACDTAWIPSRKASSISKSDLTDVSDLIVALQSATKPVTLSATRMQRTGEQLKRENAFGPNTKVLFSRGGIVLAAKHAGLEAIEISPISVTVRTPEPEPSV